MTPVCIRYYTDTGPIRFSTEANKLNRRDNIVCYDVVSKLMKYWKDISTYTKLHIKYASVAIPITVEGTIYLYTVAAPLILPCGC